jgi:preprotein translocase YajC subunit
METAMFVLIVAMAFYFILLRPVLQQQRRQRSDLTNLSVGDEVLTQAGFIARVKEIQITEEGSTILLLDLGKGLEVRAVPTSVLQRTAPTQEPDKELPKVGTAE